MQLFFVIHFSDLINLIILMSSSLSLNIQQACTFMTLHMSTNNFKCVMDLNLFQCMSLHKHFLLNVKP